MNEPLKIIKDHPDSNFVKIVKEISKLQDMPEEVIKKLLAAQGSLKDSKIRNKINGSKTNP